MKSDKLSLPDSQSALPGRTQVMQVTNRHFVNGRPILPPFESGYRMIYFGLGCFWGAERRFWSLDGVYTTAVGYIGGLTENPTYEEVCTGLTGHNEAVMVVYDEQLVSVDDLIRHFFESHDPTQGMRQGNDIGTQYRSGIYWLESSQAEQAQQLLIEYQTLLRSQGLGDITTEITPAESFYYAEDYHQQYLAKNPNGYCGLGGTGVCFA